MSAHLFVAPAAAGKTSYAVKLAREAATQLQAEVRVCVASNLQVRAFRQRLAAAGGAIGVHVVTFQGLVDSLLQRAGTRQMLLPDPLSYRLTRAVIAELSLEHYAALVGKPGFAQVVSTLTAEIKAAGIDPDAFAGAVAAAGAEPRLRELAQIYGRYQEKLQEHRWADPAGRLWLAEEALQQPALIDRLDWPLLIFDGFVSFTTVQLRLIAHLAHCVEKLVVLLPGSPAPEETTGRFRRYAEARVALERSLGVGAASLPAAADRQLTPALSHLERQLFRAPRSAAAAGGSVTLIEVPDQVQEIRAALRWLKRRLIEDDLQPQDVALVARNLQPYRKFIPQVAHEFGLSVQLVDGLPLATNPLIAALLNLLRLTLPDDSGEPQLPRRLVVETWRSPYFAWSDTAALTADAADKLDAAARYGRVISGRSQWAEALALLVELDLEESDDREQPEPDVPTGGDARALQQQFSTFLERITPPDYAATMRDFVGWVEDLIGSDPEDNAATAAEPVAEDDALHVVAQVRAHEQTAVDDLAALKTFKDVLRSIVWAEEALTAGNAVDYPLFFAELNGAVEATSYETEPRSGSEAILVGPVRRLRGLSFAAVAVIGVAEGLFPQVLREDPFLRDEDRRQLREQSQLPLDPSTLSREQESFYEAVTRGRQALLLTRPRLTESGADWEPSPYWEEVRAVLQLEPQTARRRATVEEAASWPELFAAIAAEKVVPPVVADWLNAEKHYGWKAVQAGGEVLSRRERRRACAHDGDLSPLQAELADAYGPGHIWSAYRLENYRTCAHFFFVSNVLKLNPRREPAEGLDTRQLGTLYHNIFEAVYQPPLPNSAAGIDAVRTHVAQRAAPILDAAPQQEGFRETAWWGQTRQQIVENVVQTVLHLADDEFQPFRMEARFGIDDKPPLILADGDDRLLLRGFIDRIDRREDGGTRIIDYKTAGPSSYSKPEFARGKKLQLPLYALAAEQALDLHPVVDGFYWHYQQNEVSGFTLAAADGGVEQACATAAAYAWDVVRSVRNGSFVPRPPDGGCPHYCPATGFCWHYAPGY